MQASWKAKGVHVHPSAVIDEPANIGEGTKIWHFSHVMPEARIGKNSQLGQNVYVGKGVKIGSGVKIQNNVSVYESVEIEDDVFCGPSMVFTNVINPRSFIERKHEFKITHVRRGASIGANATILCGSELGAYCLIGAGATVLKHVPAYAVMVGCPAVQKGWVCKCGVTLPAPHFEQCPSCHASYQLDDGVLKPVE
jgi:UDP-2-acetamido-3-amino-2,3-dideoxy-glucuronate N-acetyltransferase